MYENRVAFMAMIARAEGTSTNALTRDRGYDVIVTGIDAAGRRTPEIMASYAQHPFAIGPDPSKWRAPKRINSVGLASTGSGRYQILRRFWLHYAGMLKLPDFGPASQDAYVIQQLRERNALALVDGGHLDAAVLAVSGLWASLPGRAYDGQSQRTLAAARAYYQQAGGTLNA